MSRWLRTDTATALALALVAIVAIGLVMLGATLGRGRITSAVSTTSQTQYLHTLAILAGCDADINATEPLNVMAPKLAGCIAEQRARLIEYETVAEQSVGKSVQVPLPVARPKIRAARVLVDPYYRNLAREGVFPKIEHGEWP